MQTPPMPRSFSLGGLAPRRPQRVPGLRRVLRQNNRQALEAHLEADEIAVFLPLVDRDHEPPLTAAVREGCFVPLLVALLRRGAFVNEVGARRRTALHWVAMGPTLTLETFNGEPQHFLLPLPAWDQAASNVPPVPWAEVAVEQVSCGMASAPLSEEHRFALAACLLAFGALADCEDCDGLTAAEHANKNGRERLALLIRHWRDLQVSHWLQKLEARPYGPTGCQRPSLSTMPQEVRGLVCEFLAPDVCPPTSRTRSN